MFRIPHNATPSMKMLYAHNKSVAKAACDGTFDASGATIYEVEQSLGMNEDKDDDSGSDFED